MSAPAPYYADDLVRLYHGDCREISEWLDADVLVTDPPYGIKWRQGGLHWRREERARAEQSITGDNSTRARDAVLTAWGATRPAVMFGSWRQPRPERTTHRLIWHKAGRSPGVAPAAWFPNDEEIYLVGSGWTGHPPRGSVITTTERRSLEPGRWGHPTPKPEALMRLLIERCAPGVIADPFAGAGATLVAAKMLGRRAIGVELEERYCQIAAGRLTQDFFPFAGDEVSA